MRSYSYVSLFGLDSLDQLKCAIFENSVNLDHVDVEPSLESFKSNAMEIAKRTGRKSLTMLTILPMAKDYAAAVQSLAFLSVPGRIVCMVAAA